MTSWLNIAGYQLVWLVAVNSATRARPWLGVAAAALFVIAQGFASRERAADARTLLLAVGLGVAIDGSLNASGLLRYAATRPALGAPIWILAIWAAFALTFNHSLAFLRGRPVPAAMLGAIGGPAAYATAARGFGAVSFAEPTWIALLVLACAWAATMALLALSSPDPSHAQFGAPR